MGQRIVAMSEDAAAITKSARADKWLWAVRLYKTRALALNACRLNQVRLGGQPIKASRLLRCGDVLEIDHALCKRTIKVLDVLDKRVGAKVVPTFMEDLTPESELHAARSKREQTRINRVYVDTGRPTKRDRREMEAFESQDE